MLRAAGKLTARIVVEPIGQACSPGAVMELLAAETDPVWLESSALHGDYGRYTVAACRPLDVITLRDGKLENSRSDTPAEGDDAIWSALADAFGKVKLEGHPPEAGYVPGWMGYFGYEVGRHVERLPGRAVRDTHLPDMRMAFYDAVLLYDSLEQSWWLVRLKFDTSLRDAGLAEQTLRDIVARAADAPPEKPPALMHAADAKARPTASDAKSNFAPEDYRRAVAKCVDYIAAGDIFQVNLSQRFHVSDAPPPVEIYKTLRRRNPSWYAAFMSFESGGHNCAVASSSPELFVRVRGSHVITRPIKGTRPRVGDAAADEAAKADLLASAKDNAELAMIIDLLRNDIGRVCRYGTVRVTDRCRLETHPTVFHLVGTVEGELQPGVGPAELLRATFPGGSITGAPKIRAMEIIDELEPSARAVYTGCVGHVGVDGSCEWNIVIRTVICDGSDAYVQVGGGIVADSSPDGEYYETLDKARAILEAIQEAREAVPEGRATRTPSRRGPDENMKTFPIMLNLHGRLAVVVGGGQVGLRKVRALQQAGAKVRLVAETLADETGLDGVDIRRQQYGRELLEGAFLVFACTDDGELNARIAADARKIGALVNAADQPDDCDFFLPAVAADRDVVVAVGTGGASPALAAKLKDYIAAALPRHVGEFAAALAEARQQLSGLVPDPQRRMEIMRRLAADEVFEQFLARGPAAVRTILKDLARDI